MDDIDEECPICVKRYPAEERGFRPCPCGYRMCVWCWHRWIEETGEPARCPGCRAEFDVNAVIHRQQSGRRGGSGSCGSVGGSDLGAAQSLGVAPTTGRGLSTIQLRKVDPGKRALIEAVVDDGRVVRVSGSHPLATCLLLRREADLRRHHFFGQYGRVLALRSSVEGYTPAPATRPIRAAVVLVRYSKPEEAAAAIKALDGAVVRVPPEAQDDGVWKHWTCLSAAPGLSRWCLSFLKGEPCRRDGCLEIHEPRAKSWASSDLMAGELDAPFRAALRQQQPWAPAAGGGHTQPRDAPNVLVDTLEDFIAQGHDRGVEVDGLVFDGHFPPPAAVRLNTYSATVFSTAKDGAPSAAPPSQPAPPTTTAAAAPQQGWKPIVNTVPSTLRHPLPAMHHNRHGAGDSRTVTTAREGGRGRSGRGRSGRGGSGAAAAAPKGIRQQRTLPHPTTTTTMATEPPRAVRTSQQQTPTVTTQSSTSTTSGPPPAAAPPPPAPPAATMKRSAGTGTRGTPTKASSPRTDRLCATAKPPSTTPMNGGTTTPSTKASMKGIGEADFLW